jgi:hypothetical protein
MVAEQNARSRRKAQIASSEKGIWENCRLRSLGTKVKFYLSRQAATTVIGWPLETFAPKNQLPNVLVRMFELWNLILERSWERLAVDFFSQWEYKGLEWSSAKNQGKMRAIYPLLSFPWAEEKEEKRETLSVTHCWLL